MAKWKDENLTPEQKESLRRRNLELRNRNSEDMRLLLKIPAFLRFVGRWTQACGVHTAIEGSESSNVMFREGRRKVGEEILEEVKIHDFDAAVEAERMMRRDELTYHRIVGQKMKYEDAIDDKPQKGDKR